MRKVSILLFLVGLLVMGGVVSAQGTAPVICGSLAEADCSILQQSRTAMQSLTSADLSLNFTFTAQDIPEMGSTEPITVSLTGTGSFSGDMAAIGQPPANTMDPSAALDYLSKVLANFSGKLNLTINIPPSVAAMSGANVPSSIPINVVLVDGKGYLDFDSLAPVLEATGSDTSSMPKGWVGVDLVEALNQFAPMMSQMASMATQEASSANMMASLQDPEFLNKYFTVERGADVNGEAVFNSTIDMAGLLNDPVIQDLMREQASMTGGSSQAQQSIAMASMLANSMTFTMTQNIGLSDNYAHSASADFTLDLTNLMAMMSSSSSSSAATPTGTPMIKIHFDYALSNFNSVAAITAPEGATLIPLSSMMGGGDMSGMDSDMSGMDSMMEGLDSDMSGLDSMMEGMDSMMATPSSG